MDAVTAVVFILALIPALVVARRSVEGWRIPVVFAAFYPAMLIWAAFAIGALLFGLIWLGLIDIE